MSSHPGDSHTQSTLGAALFGFSPSFSHDYSPGRRVGHVVFKSETQWCVCLLAELNQVAPICKPLFREKFDERNQEIMQ